MKELLVKLFKKTYYLLAKTPLTRIPGMWNLSHFIFKIFWGKKEITDIQGSKFIVNLNDSDLAMRKTFQAYAMNRVHEETTTELFKKVVKKGDVVVDLGANIGYFTLLAAKLAGPTGKIFAFEPEPKNFDYLKKNVEINDYKNIFAFQKAVSDKNGKIKLFVCGYDSGHHTINRPKGIESYRHGRLGETVTVEIDAVTIDDFLRNKTDRVDFMKIDIEGSEALAVKGMDKILKDNANVKILIEFFPLLIRSMGNSPEEMINLFIKRYDFKVFVVGHDYSMEKFNENLVEVKDYQHLNALMTEDADHLNLFLSRTGVPK